MNWFMRKLKISLMLLLTITQACASSLLISLCPSSLRARNQGPLRFV